MTKYIFFDVGNVIFNDDPVMAEIYRQLHGAILENKHDISFKDLLREREHLILNEQDGRHHDTLGVKYLGTTQWHKLRLKVLNDLNTDYLKYHVAFPGIENTLSSLSMNFSLGIAANQVRSCRKALLKLNFLKYFDLVGLSEELGVEKPSLKFFKTILKRANIEPSNAIMIGDRIDNDILPANKMGMKTIWLNWDLVNKGNLR